MPEKYQSGERVEFMPPKGFSPPEHQGDTFDVVCTFHTKPDGSLCLTHLGDMAMPGYDGHDEENEHKEKPDYSEYTKPMIQQMADGGGY